MKEMFSKLLVLFTSKEKKKFLILFVMMIFAALLETIGIGLIIPLVTIITNPESVQDQVILRSIYDALNFKSFNTFVIFSVLFLLSVFLIKNVYLLIFQYAQARVILNQQVKLSSQLFRSYLKQPYTFHMQRNSADLLRNVNAEVPKLFQGIIMSGFQLFTEVLIILCILGLLVWTAPMATLSASILLGISVYVFFAILKGKLGNLGTEHQRIGGAMIKSVNQGLGASKEVKVSGKEEFFIKSYTENGKINSGIIRYLKLLEHVPRLFIETLLVAIVLLAMLIFVLQGQDTSEFITTMALFSMAAFRLMPSITRVVAMLATIRYSQPALDIVHDDLVSTKEYVKQNKEKDKNSKLNASNNKNYENAIELSGISFRYPNQESLAINNVSLTIPIGQSVAFVGTSGAGKTTLVDIILGILEPQSGSLLIDGKKIAEDLPLWQSRIGYIPQSIFLSDDTIRSNIAFGVEAEDIDDTRVWKALEQAQLKGFATSLPENIYTSVGERGIKLSGGQRQRLGIARALYHNPEILFMDEATSALDTETEKDIMNAIDSLKGEKTLIIIAHRLSTIENCDIVFKIENGCLVNTDKSDCKLVI